MQYSAPTLEPEVFCEVGSAMLEPAIGCDSGTRSG